jgi:uncharacterized delta-60 repeat protein
MFFLSRFGLPKLARTASPAGRLPRNRLHPTFRPQLEPLESRLLMSAGNLDPSFGSGGFILTGPTVENSKVGYSYDEARAVSILSGGVDDGKILVGGATHTDWDFGLVRLTKGGALDTSFGTGGRVVTDFGSRDLMRDMVVQADGKIVVVGEVLTSSGTKKNPVSDWDFGLARYNANGTLDTSFGNGGMVTTSIGAVGMEDNPAAVVLQADGKIVVAGVTQAGTVSQDLALVRYNPNGSLDTSFGPSGTGKVVYQVSAGPDTVYGLATQGDKILVAGTIMNTSGAGTSGDTPYLARFTMSGVLDPGFGTGGVARVPTTPFDVSTMALQPDGNIVIAGYLYNGTDNDIALARLLPNGSLDVSFGPSGNGFVSKSLGDWQDLRDVAIQGDGKIVVVGETYPVSGSADSLVARFAPDGSLDPNFGIGGFSIKSFSTGDGDNLNAVALQTDGSIGAVGRAFVTRSSRSRDSDFLVARYLASEPLIGSFTANPNPVASGSSTTLTASNITDGNPNSTITQVTFYYYDLTGNKVVLGYGTSDGLGDWTLAFTVNLASGTYTLYGQAQDNYGVLGEPDALTLTVQ